MGHPGEKSPWSNEADYCHHCGGYHEGRCPYAEPRLVWAVVIYVVAICGIFGAAAYLAGKL
jgi:hypothetical protein